MLRSRVGVDRAEEMLLSSLFDERLRGVDRLATLEGDEAIKALASSMVPGSAVRTDPRTRLAAVRALAPHVRKHAVARRTLVSVLNSVRAGVPETPLDVMARVTAALALAKAGTRATLTPLVAAVIGQGRTGEIATEALITFPPARLGPLGKNPNTVTAPVVALLGKLGDPRVLGILRKQLKRKPADIKRAAALALARLGDGTPAKIAAGWAKKKAKGKDKPDAVVRVAGAEVLMWLDSPKAATAIAQLLGDARTRSEGLRLAEQSLSPALVPTLEAVVNAKVTPAERARATSIIVRIGTATAATVLVRLLAKPELATAAAFGLASSATAEAAAGLSSALAAAQAGPPRRLILRASVARYIELGDEVAGLGDALEVALASKDAADRAVGAFGAVVLGDRDAADLAADERPEVLMAAARASLFVGPKAQAAFAVVLAKAPEEPDARTVAAAVALLSGGHGLATTRLLEWAEGGSSLSPLAAYQLARRDSEPYRKRLTGLLAGTDPIVRLHVALGLAHSPEKDAVALLADAYRFEPDVRVRRAVIRALSQRGEKRREATLRRAAELDPDPEVRGLARAALSGRKLELTKTPNGKQVAWVSLRANSADQKDAVASRPGMLVRDDGLALPVVSAPDGVILVPGIGDRHRVSVLMAVDDDL